MIEPLVVVFRCGTESDLTVLQHVLLVIALVAVAGTVGLAAAWVATASRPNWKLRVAALLLMLAPLWKIPARDLWWVLIVESGVVIAGLLIGRLGRQLLARRWRLPRFSVSDLLVVTAVVALLLAVPWTDSVARRYHFWFHGGVEPWIGAGVGLGLLALLGAIVTGESHGRWTWLLKLPLILTLPGLSAHLIGRCNWSWQLEKQMVFAYALMGFLVAWSVLLRFAPRTRLKPVFWAWNMGVLGIDITFLGIVLHDPGMPIEPLPSPNSYHATRRLFDEFDPMYVPVLPGWNCPPDSHDWHDDAARITESRRLHFESTTVNRYAGLNGYFRHRHWPFWKSQFEQEAVLASNDGRIDRAIDAYWRALMREYYRGTFRESVQWGLARATDNFRKLPGWPDARGFSGLLENFVALDARREPWEAARHCDEQWVRHQYGWAGRLDMAIRCTGPPTDWERQAMHRADLVFSLTIGELALGKYRRTFGDYPTHIEQLVPSILEATPADPHGDGPLGYRRLPNGGYLLYSVGLNGRDEGGTRGDDLAIAGKPRL